MQVATSATKESQFAQKLVRQLSRRPTTDGVVYTLDLRAKQFAGTPATRITLRAPDAPGWPDLGRTTEDEAEARRWVEESYAKWLMKEIGLKSVNPDGPRTVSEGAVLFVQSLVVVKRAADGSHVENVRAKDASLVSMIRTHVVPLLGHLPMAAIEPETVGDSVKCLMVSKAVSQGVTKREEAARGTKRRFLAALSAIWRHSYPFRPIPWAGVRIPDDSLEKANSGEVNGFDDESILLGDEDTGALTSEQLLRLLVAAMYSDLKRLADRKVRDSFLPNTAHAIALQVSTGVRISELADIRWGHIFTKGYCVIQNAKRKQVGQPRRVVPVQETVQAWLDELRITEGAHLEPNGYVIRTDPRGGTRKKAALTTLAKRIADAHVVAGVKQEGKATHGLRATYASHADNCPHIDGKTLQKYLGHHRVYGMSTDQYIRQMIDMMQDSHRRIIKLPTPDEVRAALADFVPVELKPWRERKKPQSRTKAAKDARRMKGPRRPLGATLNTRQAEG